MINISAIPNYNNQVSFSGKFMKSQALNRAIDKAEAYDLKKFNDLLERMSKADDGRVFDLYAIMENNYGRQFHMVNLKEFKMKYNTNAIENAKITLISDKDYESIAYKGALAKVNSVLDKIYPDKSAEYVGINTLIEKIYEHLN